MGKMGGAEHRGAAEVRVGEVCVSGEASVEEIRLHGEFRPLEARHSLYPHVGKKRVVVEMRFAERGIVPKLAALEMALALEDCFGETGLACELGLLEGRGAEKLAGMEAGGRGENRSLENSIRSEAGLVEARRPCELGLGKIRAADHDRGAEVRLSDEAGPLEPHAVGQRTVLLLEELGSLEIGDAVEDGIVKNGLA